MENPIYEKKAAQLSVFQRNQSEKQQKEDKPVETSVYRLQKTKRLLKKKHENHSAKTVR